jgi:purine-nucleoside phosphorylase
MILSKMSPSSSLIKQTDEAVKAIGERSPLRPAIGLVLGSGLGAFAKTLDKAVSIPYSEIPHFAASTVVGHRGELVLGYAHGVPVAVMAGRVHYYEGHPMTQVIFPVRVLGRLGVKALVLTNAAGSVNVNYKPGELMVIEDHINFMGTNPMIGPNEDQLGQRFFDMSEAYDPQLREIAEKACWKAAVTVRKGVYIAVSGPSFETPAEIRMARAMGADAVGMSTVPEVIAARHMGIRVLGISCITNMAAGVLKQKLDHREVLEVGERVKAGLMDVLGRIIQGTAANLAEGVRR